MRTFMTIMVAILFVLLCGKAVNGQTYKITKSGDVVMTKKDTTKVKVADPVYKVVGGVTFYKGAKGGIYCWKKSEKTGKMYKYYPPKDK